ncbi:MAG: hypothetical protein JNK82_32420 [Myxococcaceae bacterium]|nr:hypothetical protein [Myxococcaceae bacterium]
MIRTPGGALVPTYGDISPGGAKFTVGDAVGEVVEVLAGEHSARANVLESRETTGSYTVRVQFVDSDSGERVFRQIFAAA